MATFVNNIFLGGQGYIIGTGEGVKPSYTIAKKKESGIHDHPAQDDKLRCFMVLFDAQTASGGRSRTMTMQEADKFVEGLFRARFKALERRSDGEFLSQCNETSVRAKEVVGRSKHLPLFRLSPNRACRRANRFTFYGGIISEPPIVSHSQKLASTMCYLQNAISVINARAVRTRQGCT